MTHKIHLFFLSVSLLYSVTAHSENKGILFTVGEKILDFSGHSYNDIEKELTDSKIALKEQEELLEGNQFYGDFKENFEVSERNIGFTVYDILSAGCDGSLIYNDKLNESREMNQVKVSHDRRSRGIKITKDERKTVMRSRPSRRFAQEIRAQPISRISERENSKQPLVELGKLYEESIERSGGTLEKGVYDIKYLVSKTSSDKLEVLFEGEVAQMWNHTGRGEKYSYKLNCVGPSVEGLNKLAEDNLNKIKDSKRKIFED